MPPKKPNNPAPSASGRVPRAEQGADGEAPPGGKADAKPTAQPAGKASGGGGNACGEAGTTSGGEGKVTPAMRQFFRFKEQYPGCVLFFRMGDFYEMFYEDAELAHRVLGVTLTQRTQGVPMAGVPYHAVEGYLRRMIQAGHRVAVCDQVQDPAEARGVVERDVTRVVTAGTLTDEAMLEEGQENPLAAVVFHGNEAVSLAWAEVSTGSLMVVGLDTRDLADELARIAPRELLYCETATGQPPGRVTEAAAGLGCSLVARPAWQLRQAEAVEVLKRQYHVAQLTGFGFADDDPVLTAAGGVIHYLLETQKAGSGGDGQGDADRTGETSGGGGGGGLPHLRPPKRFSRDSHMIVDQISLRSLEVQRTIRSGEAAGSLLGVLQNGVTAMGKRLLRRWLCYPLCDRAAIEQRQEVVESMVHDAPRRDELREALRGVHDIERITARLGVNRALPRDLVSLGGSAGQVRQIAQLLADRDSTRPHHDTVTALVEPLARLSETLQAACVEAPPAHLREGGLFRDGYDAGLDESRSLQNDANDWLARYQRQLIEDTDIASLKVGYNKVFGYYIEVTAANKAKAPDTWTRKQTLKNAERYITEELKAFEGKVLTAESKAIAREQALFASLCDHARSLMDPLHAFAQAVAELDVLAGFAARAARQRYVRPAIVDDPVLHITAGRHPVLDELLGDRFVPNDVELGGRGQGAEGPGDQGSGDEVDSTSPNLGVDHGDDASEPTHSAPGPLGPSAPSPTLALITGPNMAGKSTFIRQTALITLLAHTGSFVPAEAATVGLTDRIFTRIGASDEIHAGQSTFMVEMTETANICHHATDRSLVILDEIGRGTSTLDGLALAWAIADHLAQRRPRCLFATHYHELTRLAEQHDNVTNLSVLVREWQDQIVFLHRIARGATDRSYGIHVAKIAGLPPTIIDRAATLLRELAVSHDRSNLKAAAAATPKPPPPQMSLFTQYLDHPVLGELRKLDFDELSPLAAFDALRKLRDQLDEAPEP